MRERVRPIGAVLAAGLLLAAGRSQATEEGSAAPGAEPQLADLTPLNFFSEGWAQPWERRRRHTPDMALLRVTTNFLERELRLDYVLTEVSGNPKVKATDLANALIAYGLNRRFMIEVITNYQWNVAPSGTTTNGPGAGLLARFQLVDTPGQSYALQARVSAPNKGIGQTQTAMTYALAGWQDMHEFLPALGRLGLYFSLQYENLVGPAKAGAPQNDLSYDVSMAETWTQAATPVFGNFTTFLEAFAQTLLDGTNAGRTTFSLTPGIRFWFLPENSLSLGVDLPVSHDPPFSAVYRATYILNF
jgi:hypothetical protein